MWIVLGTALQRPRWGIWMLDHLSQILLSWQSIKNNKQWSRGKKRLRPLMEMRVQHLAAKRCDKRLSHGSGRGSELKEISCWLHSQSCFVSGLLEDDFWTSLCWQMNLFHLEEYLSQRVHTLTTCLNKYAFGWDKFNESGWMAEWMQTFRHKNVVSYSPNLHNPHQSN